MPWVRIVLSQADEESGRVEQIQALFAVAWALDGGNQEAGIFRKGNMFYLSPKAVEISGELLSRFAHAQCSAPLRESVQTFCAGDLNVIPFSEE
jgi:hypothetical protein